MHLLHLGAKGMLYIDTLKCEQKVIAQAIIATDCTVFIQNCREELLQSCKTEAQKEKAKDMSDQEVIFALLYQPEVRNNKKELNHRGYVSIPCETGEEPEYEEALDILPDNTTEKEIDALLVRESLNPIIDANTTPYQREVLYLRAKGYSNSDVAEVLGKTPSEVCHHKARTEEKLRKVDALRQLQASIHG